MDTFLFESGFDHQLYIFIVVMSNSNYINNIFGVTQDELTIEHLEDFFSSPQEETSVLEFKSGEVEIIDLYKEITAFLNTEGGLLIIGAPKEKKEKTGKNEKVICEGALTYSKFKNKDWLYQKIASNIVPAPTDLSIVEFITSQGVVFIIDIPQSMHPPHQCSADGRYYIRMERESKPAPHGLVKALFDKRRVPILVGYVTVKAINDTTDSVSVKIKNESPVPAEKIGFLIDVYNVVDVECDFPFSILQDEYGDKYTMSRFEDVVLVQILSLPIELEIVHKGEDYLVMVSYWCKDADFDFKFGTYSPSERKFICKGSLQDRTGSLKDELERISGNK